MGRTERPPAELVVSGQGMQPEGCLDYDAAEARLVLAQGGERHELEIRAQAHRLVRHMAERNAEARAPVLCTHAELMQAVWGDEPLHTHEELAKLVWELRRKLEPFGAEHLLENVRGLGYRMRTCEAPARFAPPGPPPQRSRLVAAAVAVGLVAGGGVAAGILATRGSSPPAPTRSVTPQLRTFVDRIENVLSQSADGRKEIVAALNGVFACRISPRTAGRQIASVGDNRQSVLDQLGGLSPPTPKANTVVTLLQRALQQSVEADRHYRDALYGMKGAGCPIRSNLGFVLAHASDRRADAAKQRLLSVFNPLAERFGRRTWAAADI